MVAKRYIISVYPRGTIKSKEIKVELPTKPSATKLPRTKIQYNLRIEPELMDWLKELGQEYERPVNYLINHAVKQMKNEIESAKA